jgi:hypothetical protein
MCSGESPQKELVDGGVVDVCCDQSTNVKYQMTRAASVARAALAQNFREMRSVNNSSKYISFEKKRLKTTTNSTLVYIAAIVSRGHTTVHVSSIATLQTNIRNTTKGLFFRATLRERLENIRTVR